MAKNNHESIQVLTWYQHMRKRPLMYIRSLDNRGIMNVLLPLIQYALDQFGAQAFRIELGQPFSGHIYIKSLQKAAKTDWMIYKQDYNRTNYMLHLGATYLNALSEYMLIDYKDQQGKSVHQQGYRGGEIQSGSHDSPLISCDQIHIQFRFDRSIWGNNLKWDEAYLSDRIRQLAYMYRGRSFELCYRKDELECAGRYDFKNGLLACLKTQKLFRLGGQYVESHIEKSFDQIHFECAFAFRTHKLDQPDVQSYVNEERSPEHGTHVDALLKGLTFGIMKYLQKHALTQTHRISEKGVADELFAFVNIRMENPVFVGCVKHKLGNEEILKPLSAFISEFFFKKLESDPKLAQQLIENFEIEQN